MNRPTTTTPLDQIIEASKGTLVELPPFVEGIPFVAKIRRPSMLALVKSGKIPNTLLNTANDLFTKSTVDTDNEQVLGDLFKILDTLCEACFVEPTYQQLKENGVELTDDQLMFVFNYTQRGVNALDGFRSQLTNPENTANEQPVPQIAE